MVEETDRESPSIEVGAVFSFPEGATSRITNVEVDLEEDETYVEHSYKSGNGPDRVTLSEMRHAIENKGLTRTNDIHDATNWRRQREEQLA